MRKSANLKIAVNIENQIVNPYVYTFLFNHHVCFLCSICWIYSLISGYKEIQTNLSQCAVYNKNETPLHSDYIRRTDTVRITSPDNDKRISANNRQHITADNKTSVATDHNLFCLKEIQINLSQCVVYNKHETLLHSDYIRRTDTVCTTSPDKDKQISANNRKHITADNETFVATDHNLFCLYYKPDKKQRRR